MTVPFPDWYNHFEVAGFYEFRGSHPPLLVKRRVLSKLIQNGISFACRESHWSHLLIVFYFFTAVMYRNINVSGQKVCPLLVCDK